MLQTGDVDAADAILAASDDRAQDLLDNLTVLPTAAQKLGPSLHGNICSLLPALVSATRSRYAVVRHAVARCFATLCDVVPVEGLRAVVEDVVPQLGDPLQVNHRRGAVELISRESQRAARSCPDADLWAWGADIVELLDIKILPYVIFLVVPILGRMSDPEDEVRLVATNTFATLVKLVPLEVRVTLFLP